MIKEFYKQHKGLIVILHIVALVFSLFLCYYHNMPKQDERIFIFMTGDKVLKKDIETSLEEIGSSYGIISVSSFTYDENDSQFSQAVLTKGIYDTDIFIISKEVADIYLNEGLFKELHSELYQLSSEYLIDNNGIIMGIKLTEDYYLLIGQTAKSDDLITNIVNYIYKNGSDLFE